MRKKKEYHKITEKLYNPYSSSEIIHNDRIIYITYLELGIIDISYGLLEWLDLEEEKYCNKVRKTNYRVIGEESLKEYLKKNYKL